MEHEASAIARKLRDIYVIENEKPETTEKVQAEAEESSSYWSIFLGIILMGSAVIFTQLTLWIVKAAKRIIP